MQPDANRLTARIVSGVGALSRAEWSHCYPQDAEGWPYYQACEMQGVPGVALVAPLEDLARPSLLEGERRRPLHGDAHQRDLLDVAPVGIARGHPDRAEALLTESIAVRRQIGDQTGVAECRKRLEAVSRSPRAAPAPA